MSDWEDEDAIQAIPVQVPGQWDDEDQEEEVVEQIVQEKVQEKVVQVSKKKQLKKKIQEKESPRSSVTETAETAEEKKERLRNEQLKADLENAQDLFSGVALSSQGSSAFDQLNPTSAKEFDELKDLIIKKFSGFQGQLYSNFIENLIREISIDLSVDDSRRIVSTLNAMINEKQKAMKDSKKKKSGKKGITVTKGIDTTNYDDVYDEFDDFM